MTELIFVIEGEPDAVRAFAQRHALPPTREASNGDRIRMIYRAPPSLPATQWRPLEDGVRRTVMTWTDFDDET